MSLVPTREDEAFSKGYSQASEAGGMVIDHLGRRLRETEVQRDALVEALSDTLNMLRAAHIQCGVHHDSNKRVSRLARPLRRLRVFRCPPLCARPHDAARRLQGD